MLSPMFAKNIHHSIRNIVNKTTARFTFPKPYLEHNLDWVEARVKVNYSKPIRCEAEPMATCRQMSVLSGPVDYCASRACR